MNPSIVVLRRPQRSPIAGCSLLVALLLAGCDTAPTAPQAEAPTAPAVAAASQAGAPSSPVIARVAEHDITERAMLDARKALPAELRGSTRGTIGKRDLLDSLIRKRLLLLRASEIGIDRDPEHVAKVRRYEEKLLLDAVLDRDVRRLATVQEQTLRHYYEDHPEEFQGPRGELRSFEDARADIRARFLLNAEKQRLDVFVDELETRFGVEVDDAALEALP